MDLFTFASTNNDESGYQRWRAEADAARAASPAENAQSGEAELPVSSDASGYEHWHAQMVEARRAFERRWGVPAGHRVRVQLSDGDSELEGTLQIIERISPTKKDGLMLQLGGRQFRATEVVRVVRI